jgi:hypothetical protein
VRARIERNLSEQWARGRRTADDVTTALAGGEGGGKRGGGGGGGRGGKGGSNDDSDEDYYDDDDGDDSADWSPSSSEDEDSEGSEGDGSGRGDDDDDDDDRHTFGGLGGLDEAGWSAVSAAGGSNGGVHGNGGDPRVALLGGGNGVFESIDMMMGWTSRSTAQELVGVSFHGTVPGKSGVRSNQVYFSLYFNPFNVF